MWVMPDTTTTYVLQQTICGTVNYDTVTVTVVAPMNIKKLNNVDFEIFPNPNNGKFVVSQYSNLNTQIFVTNILGEVIFATQSTSDKTEIDLSKQAKGIYFVTVHSQNKVESKKIIIE